MENKFCDHIDIFSPRVFFKSFNNIMGEQNSCVICLLHLGWSIIRKYMHPADSLQHMQLWTLFCIWETAVALLVEGMMVCRRDLKTWPETELKQYFKVKVWYVISITSNKKSLGRIWTLIHLEGRRTIVRFFYARAELASGQFSILISMCIIS